jgi:RNA polymerase sigma factor for flagellar operon FliA
MEPATSATASEAALWQRLRVSGDAAAREQLLSLHLPYARIVAATYYAKRYSNEVEFEDFLQYASVGMLEALDRYDPARGVQFRTFAARRMHGSILNGIERLTERQQQIAARQRLRKERLQDVTELARLHAQDKVPDDPEQLLRMVSDVGIGLAICWMLEGTGMVESADSCALPFYRTVALRQLRERLLHAIDSLPPQEKLVVRSHYLQDLPFDAVADSMQLTKGRISQIHKQALLHLRALVREDADWSAEL